MEAHLLKALELLHEKPEIFVRSYFKDKDGNPLELAEYQIEFIKVGLSRKHPRMCIVAATQSGKTECIACLLALYAIFYHNERIVNISYTEQQARIIFERVKSHLVEDSEEVKALVDLNRTLGTAKEFSKNRMFLKNGTDIRVLSTGTGETDKTGDSILGLEATILNIDEASSIPSVVFYTKILRMLGAKRTTGFQKQLILIGTPQTAGGYFEDAFNDPDYYHMQIDWKRAVAAGRMDEQTVMEQKRKMTKTQFEAWYEAKFPAMGDDSVFDMDEVRRNIIPQEIKFYGRKILGVDVARFGQDVTVYMLMDKTKTIDGEAFREVDVLFDDGKDTMQVTGRIAALHKEHKFDSINIDDSGLGGGVTDRCKELGLPAVGVIAGAKCTTKEAEENCMNLKAELYMKAKRLFEQDKLKVIDKGRLLYELRQMKKEYQSNGKVKIIDPEKSPDFCSGLIYSIFEPNVGTFIMVDFSHSANKVRGFGKNPTNI